MTNYERPQPTARLTAGDREQLLREYYDEYARLSASEPDVLNRKVPREHFGELLGQVGALVQQEAARMAREAGPVRDFLDQNPLPPSLHGKLPDDFRAFCLALNALKQWVAAEQAATDRYLLGGTARAACRAAAERCVVSGDLLQRDRLELHHPVRDGRPPIPLDKDAHASIEGQKKGASGRSPSARGSLGQAQALVEGDHAYRASRLVFRAAIIDALAEHEAFRIVTPMGTFRMTKREFLREFASVAASRTYRHTGTYSYSRTPQKALAFLLPAETP
ncbi:MAG TPA: hypothetical protein VF705_13155 [Longimicrobium sp.]